MENFKKFFVKPLCILIMIVVVLVAVLPIIWAVISSFKTDFEIFSEPIALPKTFSFKSYKYVAQTAPVFQFLLNSLIVAFGGTFLNVYAVSMASYVVARRNFIGKGLLVTVISMTMFVPSMCSAFPTYTLLRETGLLNTKIGLILVFAGGVAVTFFVLRGHFAAIPQEIEDAAYIDGAGFCRTFHTIMLPMAKSGIYVTALLLFMSIWNNFLTPLLYTNSNSSRTLSIMLNYFMTTFATNYSAMFAAIIISVVPNIIVFILFSDKIVGGLTAGSVKG